MYGNNRAQLISSVHVSDLLLLFITDIEKNELLMHIPNNVSFLKLKKMMDINFI